MQSVGQLRHLLAVVTADLLSLALQSGRCLLVVVFGVAAATKLASPSARRKLAADLPAIVPGPAAAPGLARLLVWPLLLVEAALVALLVSPLWRGVGLGAAVGVTAVLTVGVATVVGRGISLSCHCFGADGSALSWPTVVRNAGLMTLAVVAFAAGRAHPEHVNRPGDLLAGIGAAILVGLLATHARDLRALFGAPGPVSGATRPATATAGVERSR